MIKERAVSAVKNILESASFEVDEGSGGIDLTAYGGNDCLVVLCSDDASEIDYFTSKRFKVQLEDCVAECKKLLFTMKSGLNVNNCIMWGYEDLAKYAGQATVADVLGQTLALDLAGGSSAGQSGNSDYFESSYDDYGPELLCLPASVSDDRARRIAGIKGELKRVFVPHFLYRCESTGEKVFKSHVIDFNYSETGLINGVSGDKQDIETEELEKAAPERKNVPGDAKVVDAKIKKNEILDDIKDKIAKDLTKTVRVSTSEGDTISYEDVKVSPDKDKINIKVDLVYLPVIQIRGDKVVEINAFTGKILKEPMDDGVELL
ncbi:hypothetical protein J2128_002281 [Methanomicrobium sp. W14]|uniref:hypothetical protein n=1 Tax=Methanomicrobium sp. W14 TaxID=2817839 RepID=UPI001AE36AC6|nr:hypothetical protein [Methanomicrobium sp. W14]MBP2134315.1 hypothetical protein [Methanomicrobium sp. W14]